MSSGSAGLLSTVVSAVVSAVLVAALAGVAPARAAPVEAPPKLRLEDRERQLPCPAVEGGIVVLVDPRHGALVLSTRELAGSERVGTVADGTARFSFPGLRMKELVVAGASADGRALDLWGLAVAAGEASTPDCFELAWRDGESAAELRARVAERLDERRKGSPT